MNAPLELNERELLALAERVEAATGPDRELDIWIENRLDLARFRYEPDPWSEGQLDVRLDPKPYTASLDAAMTLVPEGWDWATGTAQFGKGGHVFMRRVENVGGDVEVSVDGATPALALTSACLRAIAAKGEGR